MMTTTTTTTTTPKRLLQPGDGNTKLRKNGKEFITAGLSLSPASSAGAGNTCPHASEGCKAACLDHQGLASVFRSIADSRKRKTELYYSNRKLFLGMLRDDIRRCERTAEREGNRVAIRLNMFSDLRWEQHGIPQEFPDVQFYDYTKNPKRAGLLLPNYWVTFSRSETNETQCLDVLHGPANISVVFADKQKPYCGNRSGQQRLPKTWKGYPVIDGDISDLRFEDSRGRLFGRVVGLRLKTHSNAERAKAIETGFAVEI